MEGVKGDDKTKCNENEFLCPQLQSVNVSFCNLSRVPKIIFNLKHLTQLNLSNNYLKTIPDEIGKLHNLSILNLSGNNLSSLPDSMKRIHNLNSLDLSKNQFFVVPCVLNNGLGVLKMLNLSFNKISNFNNAPQCINTIRVLKVACNLLLELPKWIFYILCQLLVIDISGNHIFLNIQINDFRIARVFESLQVLNVENCKLSCEKVHFLSFFKNLEVLHMGNKSIKQLERSQNYLGNFKMEALKNLKMLKCLYLQRVQISILPLGFDCMENLEVLDLSENLLSWLPECLCDLVSLRVLNLTSNQILFLPNNISQLKNLQQLRLGNNKLYLLPEGIYSLKNLEFADFYNNKLEKIDFVIFKNEKLKGIDLEANCLHDCFDEEGIGRRYESLKICLRQHFNCVSTRFDSQNFTTSSDDENYYNLKLSNSYESLSDDEESVGSPQKESRDDFREEDWEDQVVHVKEDDTFSPYEVDRAARKLNKEYEWSFEFRNNYCPAFSHVPSFLETYARNIESTFKHKTVDGQFDSD